MLTRFERSRNFMSRAKALEEKARDEHDRIVKETLLSLAQQYRRLAVQAINGP
jgi:hypothetical protein